MPHRFDGIDIDALTFDNYHDLLPEALAKQVDMFVSADLSTESACLQLANLFN